MSQRLDILRHLAAGNSITPLQAFKRFGTLTLAQRIAEIRASGFPVRSEMVKVGEKRVAKYFIEPARAR